MTRTDTHHDAPDAMSGVAVCVPTFRRPNSLERCLRSLAALDLSGTPRVIVADNDAEHRAGIEVCDRLAQEGFGLPMTAVTVADRGVSAVRNALVAEALSDPGLRFVVMIDDDEWASPQWLSELLRVQALYDADIVGGPVLRNFDAPVPDYVAQANQPDFDAIPTGPIKFVDATNNILFRAELFRGRREPWFDPQYSLLGGEDMDLLLGLKLEGRRFAWAHGATVTEDMPRSRSSARWMLQRAYRIGNTDTVVKLKRRPPEFTVLRESAKVLGAAGLGTLTMLLFAWHPARRFKGALMGARALGKVVAVLGGRHKEYQVIHGR